MLVVKHLSPGVLYLSDSGMVLGTALFWHRPGPDTIEPVIGFNLETNKWVTAEEASTQDFRPMRDWSIRECRYYLEEAKFETLEPGQGFEYFRMSQATFGIKTPALNSNFRTTSIVGIGVRGDLIAASEITNAVVGSLEAVVVDPTNA